jgi:hypothetical protein
MIAQCRCLSFVAFHLRSLDALNRIVGDGVFFTEIIKQGSQRGQPVPDRTAATGTIAQVVTLGDHMRPCHGSKFFRLLNAGEQHKIFDRVFVGAAGAAIGEIGEPFDFGRHVGQAEEVFGGKESVLGGENFDGILGFAHEVILLLIKSVE